MKLGFCQKCVLICSDCVKCVTKTLLLQKIATSGQHGIYNCVLWNSSMEFRAGFCFVFSFLYFAPGSFPGKHPLLTQCLSVPYIPILSPLYEFLVTFINNIKQKTTLMLQNRTCLNNTIFTCQATNTVISSFPTQLLEYIHTQYKLNFL